ncbi:hypothetical protein BJ742DRAFT_851660 [Cladochytrium replicatum]|nr:hypothetical protein BJ742DRAFT_851660 [Cladochytrium replicatum]
MNKVIAPRGVEVPIWKKTAILFGAMTALFFLSVGLFLGQSYEPATYKKNINIFVVDFDGASIGKKLKDVSQKTITNNTVLQPGWLVVDAINYNNDPQKVIAAVNSGEAWGAIVANPDASSKFLAALSTASTIYDPTAALTFFYDQGRSPKTVFEQVIAPMRQIVQQVAAEYAADFLKTVNVGNLTLVIQQNPSLITTPISYTEQNLHPNNAPVTDSSLTFGQVILMVFSFAVAQSILQLTGPLVPRLEHSVVIFLRARIITLFVIGISLWYTVLHSALRAKFASPGNWFAFWFLQAMQMFVHVLTFINIGILVGRNSPAFPLLFLIVLILNATAGVGVIELSSEFYRWGYAMPMWNTVTASRTLLFGSYNRISLNVGLLFVWFILLSLLYVFIQFSNRELVDEDDESDTGSYFAEGAQQPRYGFAARGQPKSFDEEERRRPADDVVDER